MAHFTFGLEHEVAFARATGELASFDTVTYPELAAIIDALPTYEEDYPQLRIGGSGVRRKRWYIEGFERHDENGRAVGCVPKGIEIRTTPQPTIQGAVDELVHSFDLLCTVARRAGFFPVLTSFHPYLSEAVLKQSLNAYEVAQLQRENAEAALFTLLTYGPDLNISCHGLSVDESIDIGLKYTFYSPYIIPFTYSSPFFQGALWNGLSVRTFLRTGRRPVANVFLERLPDGVSGQCGSLKKARIASEAGRIEFKSCDSCDDFAIYAGLLALLKGLLLDTTLTGRALVPDLELHRESARQGFASGDIVAGAQRLLQAARYAAGDNDDDMRFLEPLQQMLQARCTPAQQLIQQFYTTGSICEALRQTYISW